jgi:hypothetical protein
MADEASRMRRKAAGSSDDIGKSTSRGRSRRPRERPQAQKQPKLQHHDHLNDMEDESEDDSCSSNFQVPQAQRPVKTLNHAQHEVSCSRFINPSDIPTTSENDYDQNGSLSDHDSLDSTEDWQEIAPQTPTSNVSNIHTFYRHPTTNPTPQSPSYAFPGTWTAALHDSNHALTQVSSATFSYASALATSGMLKATRSIGTAALSTTNKYAASLTNWGLAKTGFAPTELPAPVCKWLSARKEEVAKNKARKSRRCSLREHMAPPRPFRDAHGGAYVLDMHDTDAQGDFVRSPPGSLGKASQVVGDEAAWGVQDLRGGSGFEEPFQVGDSEDEDNEEEEETESDGLLRVFEFDD